MLQLGKIRTRLHSVKFFTVLILGLVFCGLLFLGSYTLYSLKQIRASNESYQTLLDQPRNAAAKVKAVVQDAVSELYAIDPESWRERESQNLFGKRARIWEPTKFNLAKDEWDDARFEIPLYREVVIEEVSNQKCKIQKHFRNSVSEKRYRVQPPEEKLFPFDDTCAYFQQHPAKTYLSKRLAWFITSEEQLAPGAKDPGELKDPIPVLDGIVRLGRRVESKGKIYLVFLALDARHLQEQAMHVQPFPLKETAFPKYLPATYTILYDNDGDFVFHPKLYDLPGYYPETKLPAPYDQGEMGPELPLPYRYPEFQQYPPKIKDLFFADGRPDGVTIDSYKNPFSNQVKTQVHAPIFIDLPGTKEPYYYGIVALGLRNIHFIERATAFNRGLKKNIETTTLAFGLLLGIFAVLFIFLAYFWWKRFSSPLLYLVRQLILVKGGKVNALNVDKMSHELQEFQLLAKVANDMLQHIQRQGQELLQRSLNERSVTVAAQVLHDIRSPVMALEVLSRRATELPEDLRVLLRQSIQRIQLLVDDLKVQQSRRENQGEILEASSPVDVVITELLLEKKLEYESRPALILTANCDELGFGKFSPFQVNELKRILSNFINNACEAIESAGRVEVIAKSHDNALTIQIVDTGRGMPSHILARLTEKGFSFDKPKGSGLGLSHAREIIEKYGGNLHFQSSLGSGTTVTLTCPLVPAPAWFIPEIKVSETADILILDDDPSIHAVWNRKFEGFTNRIQHFYAEKEFLDWYARQDNYFENILLLVDYELSGSDRNGLKIIEDLKLTQKSILVSFRYCDLEVQKQATALGVPILPKNLSTSIPITGADSPSFKSKMVLVDDDSLTQLIWKQSAQENGIPLDIYSSSQNFEERLAEYTSSTPIFIDWHLSNEDGRAVAKRLLDKGFSSVTISSGMSPSASDRGSFAWRDKTPPWQAHAVAVKQTAPFPNSEAKLTLAHDLKPIAMALNIALESLDQIPEEERELLEGSLNRLRKMISDLEE